MPRLPHTARLATKHIATEPSGRALRVTLEVVDAEGRLARRQDVVVLLNTGRSAEEINAAVARAAAGLVAAADAEPDLDLDAITLHAPT